MKTTALLALGVSLTVCALSSHASVAPEDAAAYAKAYGVSQSQAIQNLTLQARFNAMGMHEKLLGKYRNDFAGAYIEHGTQLKFHVNTKGPKSAIDLIGIGLPVDLAARTNINSVRHTYTKLERSLSHAVNLVVRKGLKADVQLDVPTNSVLILASDLQTITSALAATPIEGVRVERVKNIGQAAALIGGGEWLSDCTSGFAVRLNSNPTVTGITTAGHCSNTQYWNTTGELLPFQSASTTGANDIQWHKAPGHTPTNRIWIGDSFRNITSYTGSQNTAVGSYVCKYGRSTGYTCGSILTTAYRPATQDIISPTATYVRMGAQNTVNGERGDSGGPVFYGNSAYGSVVGTLQVDSYRVDMFYMPSQYIEAYGLQIMTYP